MPPADGELVKKIRQNDQQAFDQLFNKYKSSLYRFILYLTKNSDEADDLFQETWLRIVKSILNKAIISDFKAWIFTIAANLFRDELRKKRIRRLFFSHKQVQSDVFENSTGNSFDGSIAKADDVSAKVEFKLALQEAVINLPVKQRRVFILKEIEGFKHNEISRILGMPAGTVKSLLHRAIRQLQGELVEFQTN